ncbi:MAG: hypothetical protein KatS3mg032_2311 [Cyclobacteriaceae bacterium]|nr:MAG: hypothetical protein KatS3mg032_2311 [Cyclobacteriaceae bacterium]
MNNPPTKSGKSSNSLREFFRLNEVLTYFFRKKDPARPTGFNLRAMHTINKISMLMFLICLMVILKRCVFGY